MRVVPRTVTLWPWLCGAAFVYVAIVPWDGAAAETADPNVLATVEDWQVVRGSYLFHKGKCTLMKDPGDTPDPQLQVHPDPDHEGDMVAVLVGLDTIRAGLKLKNDDAKAARWFEDERCR